MQLPEQLNSLQKSNYPEQELCVDSTEPEVTFSKEPRYPLSRTKDTFFKILGPLISSLTTNEAKRKQFYTPFMYIFLKALKNHLTTSLHQLSSRRIVMKATCKQGGLCRVSKAMSLQIGHIDRKPSLSEINWKGFWFF